MSANRKVSHFCSLDLDGGKSNIIIKDLQPVFRKRMGKGVTLIHYRTSSLVPEKETYGNRVTKMTACIKSRDKTIRKLMLMAKMHYASQFQGMFIDSVTSFSKEIFFYETLIPAYEKLFSIEGKFKISPKYYGGRATTKKMNSDVADDYAILLTENLKVSGYYTVQKYYGLDLDHAKMAITTLARFHALGMTVKLKRPRLFDSAKNVCDINYDFQDNFTSEIIEHLVNVVKEPSLAKYKGRMKSNMNKNNWNIWLSSGEQVEPWVTIIHGDFWINSILFHNTLGGNLDDAKIIDFQLAKVGSPQADLVFFLCGSLDYVTLENHFDELIDMYYDKFIETLRITGISPTELSDLRRESFYQRLEEVARTELFHCMMGIKFFTYGNAYNFYGNTSILFEARDELFTIRAKLVALKFIEKNWL